MQSEAKLSKVTKTYRTRDKRPHNSAQLYHSPTPPLFSQVPLANRKRNSNRNRDCNRNRNRNREPNPNLTLTVHRFVIVTHSQTHSYPASATFRSTYRTKHEPRTTGLTMSTTRDRRFHRNRLHVFVSAKRSFV
jgi:hypothetical protein